MGKHPIDTHNSRDINHSPHCKDKDAPICGNESCKRSSFIPNEKLPPRKESLVLPDTLNNDKAINEVKDTTVPTKDSIAEKVKDLVIIGAGPHALTLLLRLLEPDPDFLSENERHRQAEATKQMRPLRDVYRHIKDISQGTAVNKLKPTKKKNKKSKSVTTTGEKGCSKTQIIPPPLPLKTILESTQVIDSHGDWLVSWKQNFEAIGISQLRSLMNAHADPFDHRSLEYYAEKNGRGDELVTLKDLTQRDSMFRGPYQVPSTRLFNDFHEALVQSYGVKDVVQKGKVISITPMEDHDCDDDEEENIFEVTICDGAERIKTIRSRRCVCALGPCFNKCEQHWETELRKEHVTNYDYISRQILRPDDIIQWLLRNTKGKQEKACNKGDDDGKHLLIVGGGITSAQLVFRALKDSFFKSVVFIQRSQILQRHFDVENAWMGPKRGKFLEDFFSMTMTDRSQLLREARKGGSIPPELVKELQRMEGKNPNLACKEEVEICHVDWMDDKFHVSLDDGSIMNNIDYIWLATGCDNAIDRYPLLDKCRETLPINVINGLPVLSHDLSWSSSSSSSSDDDDDDDECQWKRLARKRMYCMGALGGLQLGADALNIVGARHGAVKIANAIRRDMSLSNFS